MSGNDIACLLARKCRHLQDSSEQASKNGSQSSDGSVQSGNHNTQTETSSRNGLGECRQRTSERRNGSHCGIYLCLDGGKGSYGNINVLCMIVG